MNVSRTWPALAVTAVLAAAPMSASVAAPTTTGAAPAAHHADMHDWLADGERGLWIQAGNLRWFYARFARVCHGLNATNSLVFDTQGSGNVGRTSSVTVRGGGRCVVQMLVPSAGPPKSRYADVLPEPQAQ